MRTFTSLLAAISLVHGQVLFETSGDKKQVIIPESFPATELSELANLKDLPESIIIIGAGASGIKTAHTLISKGYSGNIKIVEGNDYVGGRMQNHNFVGQNIEVGANWVSGTEIKVKGVTHINPLWKLAKECNLQGWDDDDLNKYFDVHDMKGNDVTHEFNQRADTFEDALDESSEAALKLTPKTDMSISDELAKHGWKRAVTPIDKLVEWDELDQEDAEHPEKSSALNNLNDPTWVNYGDVEYFVQDPRGFNFVLNGMVQDLKKSGKVEILLNQDVKTVNYTPGNTHVVGVNNETGEQFTYKADSIVSTVSVGVMNANIINFEPALPEFKVNAFNQFTMGLEDKVFVAIPKAAKWVPTQRYFAIANEKKGYYPEWLHWGVTDKHMIFMTFAVAEEGVRLEGMTEKEIIDEVEQVFKTAFQQSGETDETMFRPEFAFNAKW